MNFGTISFGNAEPDRQRVVVETTQNGFHIDLLVVKDGDMLQKQFSAISIHMLLSILEAFYNSEQ